MLLCVPGEPYRVSRAVRTSSSRVDHSYGSKHKLNNAGGDYTVAAIVPHILGGQVCVCAQDHWLLSCAFSSDCLRFE